MTTTINNNTNANLKQSAATPEHCEPNATTRAALEEYEQMKNDPETYKRYKNFNKI